MSASFTALALAAIPLAPALMVGFIGVWLVLRRPLSERTTGALMTASIVGSTAALTFVSAEFVSAGMAPVDARLGGWFSVSDYEFHIALLADRLSIAMAWITDVVALLITRFSTRYLHREPGYTRFFLLLGVFVTGMHVLGLAGSYDLLFAGWELVGLASVLLVAFFGERSGPVTGATRVMVTYRVADVGLLVAGVLLHHIAGSSAFADAYGAQAWPHASTAIPKEGATWVALALLLAVMGKSAQFPFGGWLPRAMEGPTPSSALFYGALSVHAGVYLLLRSAPLIEASPPASVAIGVVGGVTAVYATLVGRTQSDAKNQLAYATMTQVGLMLVAVAAHLWRWTVLHMVGHALLRLFQLLRTPSALRDAEAVRAALGERLTPLPSALSRVLPVRFVSAAYSYALQRFFVDDLLDAWIAQPVIAASRKLDSLERGWIALLSGRRGSARGGRGADR
jgi:NADH-quinone oxidoreductase subunit L